MAFENVYTFFGADSKVGTTMIVSSLAELLVEDNNVLVINANKRMGLDYLGIQINPDGIDELVGKLSSGIYSYDDFERVLIERGRLHIIPGVKELERARHFKPEYMTTILESVSDKYDLILIDAGSDLEFSGLAIGALTVTENSVIVATQQEKTWNELKRVIPLTEKLKIKFRYLLVNKMQSRGSDLVKLAEMGEYCKAQETLESVPHSPYSWQCESEYKTLSNLDTSYKNKIHELAEGIATKQGLSYNQKKRFSLFGKK